MKGSPKISVKQVVSAVIRNLGIQDAAREFHNFVEWAFEAEKKIGSYSTFDKKIATLTVASKKVLLPTDFLNMIEIRSTNGGEYDNTNCYMSGNYLHIDLFNCFSVKM